MSPPPDRKAAAPLSLYAKPEPPPRASHFITWRGRSVIRCRGFMGGKALKCPDGHTMSGLSLVREDHTLQCTHRAAAGQGECGALVYVLMFPGFGGKRRFWACDVTMEEVREMERLGLDADGVLAYFGEAFTREKSA